MTRQGNCRSGGRIATKSLKTSLTTTWPFGYVESLRISSHLHSNGNKKPREIIKSLWSNQNHRVDELSLLRRGSQFVNLMEAPITFQIIVTI